jgi:hypothetical protein
MLALTSDGVTFGHRETTREGGAAPGMIWCEFDEIVEGQPQHVRAAVLLWRDLQVRLAYVWPSRPVRAFEAPGTLGCVDATRAHRRSDPVLGWEYAEAEGRAVGIRRLLGYDGQAVSAPFLGHPNLNLAFPYAEQPLVCELQSRVEPRPLAALSLVRPEPFDPALEFDGTSVGSLSSDALQVTFPDGEQAFVSLGDAPPSSTSLAGISVTGEGIRCVRISRGIDRLCGFGISNVSGIVSLARPGILHLIRNDDRTVRITTNQGLSVAADWLGGLAWRTEVLTLEHEWKDVTNDCQGNSIPSEVVRSWSQIQERVLIQFRLSY